MSFGLQTFNADGSVDFDSDSPHMRVVHKQRVTGSTQVVIQNHPPPYFVILLSSFTDGTTFPENVTPISYSQSGNTISVVYLPFTLNGRRSTSFPATMLVCK